MGDLEPSISKETMEFHYGKHYSSYCNNLEKLIVDTHYEKMELIDIIKQSEPVVGGHASNPIYNNAAQVWNHEFYFNQFSADESTPSTELSEMIDSTYGGMDKLKQELRNKFVGFFGIGWVWLVITQHKQWDSPILQIVTTRDGDTITNEPNDSTFNGPMITLDVWEHAYYIDHRNDRDTHFNQIWGKIDWNVVSARYTEHKSTLFDYTKPFEL